MKGGGNKLTDGSRGDEKAGVFKTRGSKVAVKWKKKGVINQAS